MDNKPSSTERSKIRRARIKLNTSEHEKQKEKDKIRKRNARKTLKDMCYANNILREQIRAKKREEVQKYRSKKIQQQKILKQKELMLKASHNMTESLKKRQAEAEKVLEAKRTQKRQAVLRTQRWRLRICLNDNSEPKSARLPSNPESKDTSYCENTHPDSDDNVKQSDTPFSSRWSEFRAIKRVKDSLPNSPSRKARLVEKLACSPSTSKELKKRGVIATPAMKEMAVIGTALIHSVSDMRNMNTDKSSVRQKPAKDQKDRKHAKKTLAHLLEASTEKSKKKRKMQYRTGLWTKVTKNTSWWRSKLRKIRKGRVCTETKAMVTEFYMSGEVSRCVPNKKDVSSKDGQPKFVMTSTISDAHQAFVEKHPDRKIGLTSFYNLKPKNVRKVSETNRKCCLCQICCNAALLAEGINKFLSAQDTTSKKVNKRDLANILICDFDVEPDGKCIQGNCDKCGQQKLKKHFEELEAMYGDATITYHKWETINIEGKDGQTKRCVSCVAKSCSFSAFLETAKESLLPLPAHLFRAKWQLSQLEKCKSTLKDDEAVVIMDYAENYSCRFQNEVQSAFWDTNQVTIHPMMAYYTAKDDTGQTVTKKHSVIGVSNDPKHDAHGVAIFRDLLYQKVAENKDSLNMIYEWTDGAACQYKGRVGFADISSEEKFAMQRNFFETSHGKNVCDGLGATVKNACHQAVISGKRVIGNAKDLFAFCNDKLTVKKTDNVREFVYVDVKDVDRQRPSSHAATLCGTRKLHSVRTTQTSRRLEIRNLSCFCDGCRTNKDCQYSQYVDPWTERVIVLKSDEKDFKTAAVSTGNKSNKKSKKQVVQKNHKQVANTKKRAALKTPGTVDVAGDKSIPSAGFLSKDTYVSVRLGSTPKVQKLFKAKVLDVDNASQEVHLSFMQSRGSLFTWPEPRDESWEPMSTIQEAMSDPVLSSKSTNKRKLFVFTK